jgi:hypothetical protein
MTPSRYGESCSHGLKIAIPARNQKNLFHLIPAGLDEYLPFIVAMAGKGACVA